MSISATNVSIDTILAKRRMADPLILATAPASARQ
jgi:hypothetical protein